MLFIELYTLNLVCLAYRLRYGKLPVHIKCLRGGFVRGMPETNLPLKSIFI